MKTPSFIILLIAIPLLAAGQDRRSGQIIVPLGWESQDSIRLGFFDINPQYGFPSSVAPYTALEVNFNHTFGSEGFGVSSTPFKGILDNGSLPCKLYDLRYSTDILKQSEPALNV